MTGPDHYREAEKLTAKAHEYLGQGDDQNSAAVWAAVAQIHATLDLVESELVTVEVPVPTLSWFTLKLIARVRALR